MCENSSFSQDEFGRLQCVSKISHLSVFIVLLLIGLMLLWNGMKAMLLLKGGPKSRRNIFCRRWMLYFVGLLQGCCVILISSCFLIKPTLNYRNPFIFSLLVLFLMLTMIFANLRFSLALQTLPSDIPNNFLVQVHTRCRSTKIFWCDQAVFAGVGALPALFLFLSFLWAIRIFVVVIIFFITFNGIASIFVLIKLLHAMNKSLNQSFGTRQPDQYMESKVKGTKRILVWALTFTLIVDVDCLLFLGCNAVWNHSVWPFTLIFILLTISTNVGIKAFTQAKKTSMRRNLCQRTINWISKKNQRVTKEDKIAVNQDFQVSCKQRINPKIIIIR